MLGVRSDQIMVGGESAGGGMAAALCMLAHDRGTVRIAFQMPIYPMLDDGHWLLACRKGGAGPDVFL